MTTLLNPHQQSAVAHIEGPLLVLAGAGSGKTRIVTERIAHLIERGTPASQILAVTFTNKAAEEMRSRIQKICNKKVLAATFHSLCARILRESISALGYTSDFIIYDSDDALKLLKVCMKSCEIKDEKGEIKLFHNQISNAKNALLSPDDLSEDELLLKKVYGLYQNSLKSYNALDFDDLLFLTVQLFQEHPEILTRYQNEWQFLLIDEYQDTNMAQYKITRLLAERHHNLFAVGDPDQSIYSWRGADINNILNFKSDFPGARVVTLEQNYRSRDNILQAANALISVNQKRYEKRLWSERSSGEPIGLYICDSDRAEAEFIIENIKKHQRSEGIKLSECVVFYRTNSQSRTIEDALLKYGIPYQIVGGLSFYQRREIKDLLAFVKLLVTDSDFISFTRVINLPKRGIGDGAITQIKLLAENNQIGILAACRELLNGSLSCKFSQKQREGLKAFIDSINKLRTLSKTNPPINELISDVVQEMGYLTYLKEDKESYAERRSNIAELISKAAEWSADSQNGSLQAFLEELALKSSAEENAQIDDKLQLMTLHNGKGLEFKVVFITGMEEELFPHINSRDTPDQLEEERRLCYVGMTRAKDQLYLTAARFRYLWGTPRQMRPSRFLQEIPKEFLKAHHHQSGDLSPTVDPLPEESELKVGSWVYHRDFGKGVIHSLSDSPMGPIYEIFFQADSAPRRLVAKFAKLSQIQSED